MQIICDQRTNCDIIKIKMVPYSWVLVLSTKGSIVPPLNLSRLCDCFSQQNMVEMRLCHISGSHLTGLSFSTWYFSGNHRRGNKAPYKKSSFAGIAMLWNVSRCLALDTSHLSKLSLSLFQHLLLTAFIIYYTLSVISLLPTIIGTLWDLLL